jgi:hypothetical protein
MYSGLDINSGVQIRDYPVTTHETLIKLAAEDAECFQLSAALLVVHCHAILGLVRDCNGRLK